MAESGKQNEREDKTSREYIVNLLKQDAVKKSEEYKTKGVEAYTKEPEKRPLTTNTNKRFLNNLIKSTTSHNGRIEKSNKEHTRKAHESKKTKKHRSRSPEGKEHHHHHKRRRHHRSRSQDKKHESKR